MKVLSTEDQFKYEENLLHPEGNSNDDATATTASMHTLIKGTLHAANRRHYAEITNDLETAYKIVYGKRQSIHAIVNQTASLKPRLHDRSN